MLEGYGSLYMVWQDGSCRSGLSRAETRSQAGLKWGDTMGCHHCGKVGHFKWECPKLQAEQEKGRGEASKPSQSRGQTSKPRVYELSKDEDETKPFKSITGNNSRLILFQFSRIAWYET